LFGFRISDAEIKPNYFALSSQPVGQQAKQMPENAVQPLVQPVTQEPVKPHHTFIWHRGGNNVNIAGTFSEWK
jgi:hypothetical protein